PQIADFVRRRPLLQSEIDNARLANVYAVGEIDLVFNRFQNRAFREISGWDFGFEYAFPENALGNFTLDGNATYMSTYKEQDEEGGPVNDDLLGDADRALPRFRGQLGLRWRNEQWRGAVSYRYISGLIEDDVVSDPDLDPSGEAQLWRVSPWKGVNLSGAYRFMDGFMEGSRISLGVRNLFNEDPPLNPDESYGYESNVHSNRGRFYYGEIRYDF
ncbi:MAG: hypothetical protein MI861_29160, partial [Pirellulales bacterium]|nr:hypothetical protein [Pirellulales bacterium]